MNAQRRKEIQAVLERLDDVATEIRRIGDDERNYYDTMPESIQAGRKGDEADETASRLEEIANTLDEQYSELDGVLNGY